MLSKTTRLRLSNIFDKVKSKIDDISDLAHVVNEMGPKPAVHNYVALGTLVLGRIIEMGQYHPSKDRTIVDIGVPHPLGAFIRDICKAHSTAKIYGKEEEPIIALELPGAGAMYITGKNNEYISFLFSEKTRDKSTRVKLKKEYCRAIGRLIWETLGTRLCVTNDSKNGNRLIVIKSWETGEILESPQSRAVCVRLKKFFALGKNRAIMFFGPPGTGKTCLMQALVNDLGWPTLYLESEQIKNATSGTFQFLLESLCPYIIAVDDLDRITNTSNILHAIDKIRETTKLLMVTANHRKLFDSAAIRAKRFDEHVRVIKVKQAKDVIPNLTEKLYKELDSWPIAFLEELKDRIEVLGIEDVIANEMEELRERVKHNEGSPPDIPDTFDDYTSGCTTVGDCDYHGVEDAYIDGDYDDEE